METPTDWSGPVFLMNFPLSVSNLCPNNALMKPSIQGEYDKYLAGSQWFKLYQSISSRALVYILPGHEDFQDLPFVANLGCYLPHITKSNIILLSNFSSVPSRGEEVLGRKFFESFDYVIEQPSCYSEGEADLKWVRDNIYVGGSGLRSMSRAYDWMRNKFGMNIIDVEMLDAKLYHLDCVFFPLTETKAVVSVSCFKPEDIKKLEKFIEIIEVPKEYIYKSWTNCVRIGDVIFHAPEDSSWKPFETILQQHGFKLEIFNLSEFDKSGADLSCLCMHLNDKNRF